MSNNDQGAQASTAADQQEGKMDINLALLDEIELKNGGHNNPAEGLCFMEAVAYVRGIPHTDRPACVSPMLGAWGRSLNDNLPHDARQRLKPLIPLVVGTAGDGMDSERSRLVADWFIREHLPALLRFAHLASEAETLAALPPLSEDNSTAAVKAAARAARAAWDAWDAWDARAAWDAWDAWAATFILAALQAAQQAGTQLNGDNMADLMAPMVKQLNDSQIALFARVAAVRP